MVLLESEDLFFEFILGLISLFCFSNIHFHTGILHSDGKEQTLFHGYKSSEGNWISEWISLPNETIKIRQKRILPNVSCEISFMKQICQRASSFSSTDQNFHNWTDQIIQDLEKQTPDIAGCGVEIFVVDFGHPSETSIVPNPIHYP